MPKLATRSVSKIWLDRLAKDRKSNATFGSIFDSGGLSQSPISHQEVLGAAIKLPQRTPSAACSPDRSRGRRLFGLQARVIPDERGLIVSHLDLAPARTYQAMR